MAVCPQCGNSLVQDFGVVSCSQCQAVLFVDMEGLVHFSGENQESQQEQINEVESPPEGLSEDNPAGASEYADNWMSNEQPEKEAEIISENSIAQVEELELQEPELDIRPGSEPQKFALNDFSDVESFGNSNSTVGPLTYTVIIEDINTKEVRALLMDALTDRKFQWDSSDLMKKIKDGKLTLEDLNPVKASVLIHRIRELKVKISWRQNVYV